MKRVFSNLLIAGLLTFGMNVYAQDAAVEESAAAATEEVMMEDSEMDTTAVEEEPIVEESTSAVIDEIEEDKPFTQILKTKFIEGGPGFMGIVLLVLILGLAIVIERILYLSFADTNADKLLKNVESALENGGLESAKEVCRNQRGPIASVYYAGLEHYEEGIDMVDKSIGTTGSVEAARLEKGISWISLFIALAPMLGFMGTVIGMIQAFDSIEAAGDISPSLVAGGIKVALLTTVFGLIVAIILQIFYNFIIAKLDGLVVKMEDASINFMDMLVAYHHKNKK
jgi:biopolymer transport protein ExbB